MAIIPIQRISMPDDAVFLREYVSKRTPVIITDLFDGQAIRQIKSVQDAANAFGAAKLRVQPEYVVAAESNLQTAEQILTFDEYWHFVRHNPSTSLMCSEYEIPAPIMALFELPTVCRARDLGESEYFSLPRKYGDHDLFANVFIGNRGNRAHLHYDGDHRQVFLYQVFGRKEVILFQPESGINLRPLDCLIGFSGIFLELMDEDERKSFVDANNGYYAVLQPGETVYLPMLIWHYLGYSDDAMSFNIRFGRNRCGRFLCADNLHRDYYIQNFAAQLGGSVDNELKYKRELEEISREYRRPAARMEHKVESMRVLFRELATRCCPGARIQEYCPASREPGELAKIMQDIQAKTAYADPTAILASRQTGPVSNTQKRHIAEAAARRRIPGDVLQRLLWNRIGKSELDSLTRAEAALFIKYIVSPGAEWS